MFSKLRKNHIKYHASNINKARASFPENLSSLSERGRGRILGESWAPKIARRVCAAGIEGPQKTKVEPVGEDDSTALASPRPLAEKRAGRAATIDRDRKTTASRKNREEKGAGARRLDYEERMKTLGSNFFVLSRRLKVLPKNAPSEERAFLEEEIGMIRAELKRLYNES